MEKHLRSLRRNVAVCIAAAMAAMALPADAAPAGKAKAATAHKAKAAAKTAPARRANAPAGRQAAAPAPSTPYRKDPYVGAISAVAKTGKVLFSDNANAKAYPASCTKLMTALLVLEDVAAGKYALQSQATASVLATFEEPSSVGIKPGQSMTIDDLLTALMVKSANDAAVVLAEHSAGSIEAFIARMNARAAELGMSNTRYDSPNGLPPYGGAKRRPKKWRHDYDCSTAADLLKLGRELVLKHPEILRYTSKKIAEVTDGSGKPLTMVNHNNVMVKDKLKIFNPDGREAVDGLKTGYIDAGGSSIVMMGSRDGQRVLVVVLGSQTSTLRDENASRLMRDALGAVGW